MADIGVPELLIIVAVVMVLFGAKRLPDAARSFGRSLRIFKSEVKGLHDDDHPADTASAAPARRSPGRRQERRRRRPPRWRPPSPRRPPRRSHRTETRAAPPPDRALIAARGPSRPRTPLRRRDALLAVATAGAVGVVGVRATQGVTGGGPRRGVFHRDTRVAPSRPRTVPSPSTAGPRRGGELRFRSPGRRICPSRTAGDHRCGRTVGRGCARSLIHRGPRAHIRGVHSLTAATPAATASVAHRTPHAATSRPGTRRPRIGVRPATAADSAGGGFGAAGKSRPQMR